MNLRRFEPWSIVDLLHRDLDRLAVRQFPAGDSDAVVTGWVPAVDIIEEKERFVLRADVPGVDPADIEVSMDAGVLSSPDSGRRRRTTKTPGCSAWSAPAADSSVVSLCPTRPMPSTSRRSAATASSRSPFRSSRRSRRAASKSRQPDSPSCGRDERSRPRIRQKTGLPELSRVAGVDGIGPIIPCSPAIQPVRRMVTCGVCKLEASDT